MLYILWYFFSFFARMNALSLFLFETWLKNVYKFWFLWENMRHTSNHMDEVKIQST